MNTIRFKASVRLGCLLTAVIVCASSCGKSDIKPYDSKAKLWFTQKNKEEVEVGNIVRSFSHYPGSETLDVEFEVNLIGPIVDYDRKYRAVIVDTLTTADPAEYEIHPMVFHADKAQDILTVTLKKSDRLLTDEVKLTLHLAVNETFELGYSDKLKVSVSFNDITTKPEWWTDLIAKSYFGEFSKEKFNAFYAYCGRNEIEGLQPSELRKLLLGFKDYIREHDLREADGTPITLPIY